MADPTPTPRGPGASALREVEQRTGYDCIRACLASITGINVPDFTSPFVGEKDIRPFGDSQTWLRSRGWDLLDDTGERPMPGWSLAVGPSPTIPSANHATVALDGVVVWDPSPNRDDPGRVFEPSGFWPVRLAAARADAEPALTVERLADALHAVPRPASEPCNHEDGYGGTGWVQCRQDAKAIIAALVTGAPTDGDGSRCVAVIRTLGLSPAVCGRPEDNPLHHSAQHPDRHPFTPAPTPPPADGTKA